MINLKNIKFKYKNNANDVINDVSLNIKKNTINVLLGLNACGKTTLLKIMNGLLKPQHGVVEIAGNNIISMSHVERAKKMSFVLQRQNIASDFTVFNYLAIGYTNSLKFYEQPTSSQKEKVVAIAEEFGIGNLLNRLLDELSGGQLQMVSICKALIQDSEIILLDEPTSALDMRNQNIVLSTLKRIAEETNKTIIITTHNPNHALYLKANVVIMNKGKIINEGNSEKLINKESLTEIYGNNICYSNELEYNEVSFK